MCNRKKSQKVVQLAFEEARSFKLVDFSKKQRQRGRERERERDTVLMEESKGVVKHVLLAKFKGEIPSDEIEKLIKGYANLVNLIEPMKAFEWYDHSPITDMKLDKDKRVLIRIRSLLVLN
ncbi:hypothetical protein OIU77_014774 [Salix suchowensis]|uniref:Stress-response A/B barrel domain-containing protein n=1 Tax=Salix suchowensis TaxID=1278906 RepID=A0ABQ8ZYF2_9ROSI|nr:hypothetical protein OIU77_014774 [Salix suchowensis]